MKKTKLPRRLSLVALAVWFASGAFGIITAAEGADRPATIPIGLNGVPNQDHLSTRAIADEFQLNFFTKTFQWLEPQPGEYFWKEFAGEDPFRKHLQSLKQKGYAVSLTNTTVHMDQKHIPKYLEGKPFDDPELLARWEAFLTAFLARYGDAIDFLNLSNEVGSYFGSHQREWPEYMAFVRRGAETVRKLRPEIRVSVVLTRSRAAAYWRDLEPHCDYLAFTYYAPASALGKSPTADALDPNHPNYFAVALDDMLRVAGAKPVLITEIGCATHESVDSSPELQAKFIERLFAWLPGKEDRILGLSWLSHIDWPYAHTKQALQGYLDEALLERESFLRFLTSLGLMYEDGAKKPGYEAFKGALASYRRGDLQPLPPTQPRHRTGELSNGGFEAGDLSEAASNVMGARSWMTSNSGHNAIAVTKEHARTGSASLKWHPIGWNVKDNGKVEDASTFIITRVDARSASQATAVRLSGAVNTSTLDAKFKVSVVLANGTLSKVTYDTLLRGGVPGWQTFDTSLGLGPEDDMVFVAFMVVGSKGVGAGQGAVYIDDLALSFTGSAANDAAAPPGN